MAWTTPTALLFVGIGLLLGAMTVWELRSPSVARRGWLPMETTRGDRLFVGLLAVAVLHLAWAGLTDQPLAWIGVPGALVLLAVGRWG